jgi:hypothetical protein
MSTPDLHSGPLVMFDLPGGSRDGHVVASQVAHLVRPDVASTWCSLIVAASWTSVVSVRD